MSDPIIIGNTLHADLTVKDDLLVLTDPTTLTFTVKTPSGVETTYLYPSSPIVRSSVGAYYAEFVLSEIGIWEYEWVTTNPSRNKGSQVYVEGSSIISTPSVGTIADHTKFWLGGENWSVLRDSENFGISHILLGIENVKRRVLASPPAPKDESALNRNVLVYLGIICALELIPATQNAWASKLITRSTGNEPSEVTSYTDRAQRIVDLQDMLLRRVAALYAAAKPYLDATIVISASVAGIDEDSDDARVTDDPRTFPPAWSFPYDRDQVIR